jgi:hypothetical protein
MDPWNGKARRAVALIASALLAAAAGCEGGSLPCAGPSDCSGNACCYDLPITYAGGPAIYCTSSPTACAPKQFVDMSRTRLCRVDADCTAGPIDTAEAKCCPSAVASHAAGTCHGSCLPR